MRILLFIIIWVLTSAEAYSLRCEEVLVVLRPLIVERYLQESEKDKAFHYLETLMTSLYNPRVFRAKLKVIGHEELENISLTDIEVIRIMVRFLEYNYTHVSLEALEEGTLSLGRYMEHHELKPKEVIVSALIKLYSGRVEKSSEGALLILGKRSTPEFLWYRAMIHYKRTEYLEAKRLLSIIKGPSAKTREALHVIEMGLNHALVSNRLEHTGFDSTQWGSYE